MARTFTTSLLCLLFLTIAFAQKSAQDLPLDDLDAITQAFVPEVADNLEAEFLKPEGRTLSAYPNIRIGTDFELLTAGTDDWRNYIQYQLIPGVIDYLQAALKTKYPMTTPITSTAKTLCGFTTPSVLATGVDADVFIFINSKDAAGYSWIAATTLCTVSSGVRRPMIVNIGINTAAVSVADPTTNPLTHDLNLNVIIHEFVHALGMNGPLYNYFVDDYGNYLTNHVKTTTVNGNTRTVLDLPPLTNRLRSYYGCDTIPGLVMEYNAGAHVARRFFQWDLMTTAGIIGTRISEITLGFLEGTGWYSVDYNYAEPYYFGKGAGCDFYSETIDSANFPDEYCTGNGIGCTEIGNGGGYCVSDSLIQVGRVVTAQYAFNCENPSGIYYTPFSSKQIYGRGKGSKCFTGNLTTSSSTVSQTSYCVNATCSGTGLSTVINFLWGTTQYQCTAAGPLTIAGYKGQFNCPDPITFCSTVGLTYCPRNCMGRGTCLNGQCVCKAGYQGTDCGFTIDTTTAIDS